MDQIYSLKVFSYRKHAEHNRLWKVPWQCERRITAMLKLGIQNQKQTTFLPLLPHAQKPFRTFKGTVNFNKHRQQDNTADMHIAQKHMKWEEKVGKTLDSIYAPAHEIGQENLENSGQPICPTGMSNCLHINNKREILDVFCGELDSQNSCMLIENVLK